MVTVFQWWRLYRKSIYNDLNTDNQNDNEIIENPITNDEIDRSKYLTGEIITDGVYTYPSKVKNISINL